MRFAMSKLIMSVQLPYNLKGIIASYNYIGGAMSLISSNKIDYFPWLVSEFTVISWRLLWHNLDFNKHNLNTWKGLVVESKILFDKNKIIDFIKNGLDNEKYVYMFVNEYYMHYSESYLLDFFPHDIYIIGYNDSINYFTGIAYNQSKKITIVQIAYEDLLIAYMTNLRNYKITHVSIDLKYNFSYLNEAQVLKNLLAYIKNKKKYVYRFLLKQMENACQHKKSLDLTSISIYIEHKYVLSLYDNDFSKIHSRGVQIKLLLMKYNLVHDKGIIIKCISLLKKTEIEEGRILKKYA